MKLKHNIKLFENLKLNKKEIERGWMKFAETIKKTQRDLLLMEKIKKIDPSDQVNSFE